MTNHLMTTLMWAIAIAHVLTDRVLWPFVQSVFAELMTETPAAAAAPPLLTVAVTEAPASVEAAVKPRPRRRRTTSSKAAA